MLDSGDIAMIEGLKTCLMLILKIFFKERVVSVLVRFACIHYFLCSS